MAARGPFAKWIRGVQLKIADVMLPQVRRRVGSRTLRKFLQPFERVDGKAVLGVPHYWAVYYHDGSGGFGPRRTTYLVFFPDALLQDPRLGGQYPIRFSEWRPLTKEEFRIGLEINRSLGFGLSGPFMTVTRFVGPRKGDPFFENTNPSREASKIVPDAFSRLVRQQLGRNFQRKGPDAVGKIKV